MGLLSRIYYNAVCGGLGGLLGWLLFGVFGDRNPSSQPAFLFFTYEDLNLLLGGTIIGGLIGFFVVAVEAMRDQSVVRFSRLASYGVALGAAGGAVGMWLGDKVNFSLQAVFGSTLLVAIVARGIGWSFLGVAIGMSEGVAARSLSKVSYGTLGGALGGFLGGAVFELFYTVARASLSTTYFWSALGLIILGACIGSLSALVQGVFQPACVRILRGWQEGREYALDKPASLFGRAESADIALFRDMKVEKQHASIKRDGERFVLVNHESPPQNTLVNDAPVRKEHELNDGDRIQLGNVLMRFQTCAAANRKRGRKAK